MISHHQNIVENQNIVIENLSFEKVDKFKYLGVTVTNTNDICGEIKRRINMGNACYYSLEKILSSHLLSKKLKVNTCKTIILLSVLYGCETWSLTLREEHRLRVFENKVLRKIFGAKRYEITGKWRQLHNAELHTLYSSPIIIRNLKLRRLRWAGHLARLGNACCYSLEKILSSHLLSKKLKVNTYKTIIIPRVLHVVKLGLSHLERSTG